MAKTIAEINQRIKDGNAVVVTADEIIDIGPGAGKNGGEIVYQGNISDIKKVKNSYTGQFIAGTLALPEKPAENKKETILDWLLTSLNLQQADILDEKEIQYKGLPSLS